MSRAFAFHTAFRPATYAGDGMQGPVEEGRQGILYRPSQLLAPPAVQHKQTEHGHEGKDMRGRQERDGVNDLLVRAEKG